MSTPLLKTKLNIPPRRPNMVARSRLLRRLDEALRLGCRLILVSAQAGAGKTALMSEWLGQQEQRTTWLSLDANDNDPRRFFACLVAALERVDVEIAPALTDQIADEPSPEAEAVVAALINGIGAHPISFILVLDDYHLIEDPGSTFIARIRLP